MKLLQSSVFRAICAIAVGIMLIKYPDNTVTWITIAIGVLFLFIGYHIVGGLLSRTQKRE